MIARQWHGWTSKNNGDAYAELFRARGLNTRQIEGKTGAYLLRRDKGDEVEFVVLSFWTSMEAIRAALGDDFEVASIIPGAENLLSRYDGNCIHFEVADEPSQS